MTAQSIETEVAAFIAHTERTNRILERTGGEAMHPDHYDFRQAFRDATLAAMDDASGEHGMTKVLDSDLPELFRTIDALAEKLWLRRMGYKG